MVSHPKVRPWREQRRNVETLASDAANARPADPPPLTRMELRVLWLAAQGLLRDEIADRLFFAPSTAKRHLEAIRRKFNARNTAHAVSIGYQRGILPPKQTRSADGSVA